MCTYPKANQHALYSWQGTTLPGQQTGGGMGVKLNIGGSVHDFTDPIGRLLFTTLTMIAEFEADLARARTREGMAVARAKGRLRGIQPKLSPRQEAHLVQLYRGGQHTISELEELFPITRSAIYRADART